MEIREYDARWPELAEVAADDLMGTVPGTFTAIEHIGSTSVPGLAAKPIIDLMAATVSLDAVIAQEDALRLLGYERYETGMSRRLFYARDDNGARSHHLHVVDVESWPTRNERLLRDHLRAHPGGPPLREPQDGVGAIPPGQRRLHPRQDRADPGTGRSGPGEPPHWTMRRPSRSARRRSTPATTPGSRSPGTATR